MNKYEKSVSKMIVQQGLKVESFQNTGKHLKIKVTNKYGVTGILITSKTPSCSRAALNFRSTCRRYANKTTR